MTSELYFPKWFRLRDGLGCTLFLLAAVLSGLSAWETPSILAILNSLHNALLASLYATRLPAQRSDHFGLFLGLTAAFLPAFAGTSLIATSPFWTAVGISGELLVLWSLVILGKRFGIAPADRGPVKSGPYRLVRHPMYLGELVLRLALAVGSPEALIWLPFMFSLQILRALREERVIAGYPDYAQAVRWRLIPFIF
jgi:protein-S-isoprenylcysteine O-methyltransferase Ste14